MKNMSNKDDVMGVRQTAKVLCRAVEISPHPKFPFLCQHPFTSTVVIPVWDNENKDVPRRLDLTNFENYAEWERKLFDRIDRADVGEIFALTDKPWRLTLLKYIKEYLSTETFSELFGEAWVISENPNGDANCSLALLTKWFRNADKKFLMDEEEYKVWEELPEEFVVYRGVGVGRKPLGLSWTCNLEKAEWFAHRYDFDGKVGYVQKATINKKYAYAYFKGRGEEEVVVDSAKIKDCIQIITE